MRLLLAKYDDICMTCTKKIEVGDWIFWSKKNSHHKNCYQPVTVTEKWLAR